MDLKRWTLGAALLLSTGTLANCRQIFGGADGGEEGRITSAVLIGAGTAATGAYISFFLDGATGGLIVLMQTVLFLLAFVFAPRHGRLAARRAARLQRADQHEQQRRQRERRQERDRDQQQGGGADGRGQQRRASDHGVRAGRGWNTKGR